MVGGFDRDLVGCFAFAIGLQEWAATIVGLLQFAQNPAACLPVCGLSHPDSRFEPGTDRSKDVVRRPVWTNIGEAAAWSLKRPRR